MNNNNKKQVYEERDLDGDEFDLFVCPVGEDTNSEMLP